MNPSQHSNDIASQTTRPSATEDNAETLLPILQQRLAELEEMERQYQATLENLYLHQEELKTQNDELRHAQTSLENARRRHQDLFDFSPVAQFLVSPNGMILKANRVAGSLLGLEASDLFNYHMPNLAGSNSDRVALLHFLTEVSHNKIPQPVVVDLFRRDGGSVRVQLHGSRSSAQHESSLLLTAVDNSRFQELEYEQERRTATERLLEALWQNSSQCVFVTDPAWRFIKTNAGFSRLAGYPIDELLGRKLDDFMFWSTSDAENWQVWQSLQTGGQWSGETMLRDRFGTAHPVMLKIVAVRDTHQRIEAYLGLC